MESKLAPALEGWIVDGDYYVRNDGVVRVNRSYADCFARPFAVFPKHSHGCFAIWAPHKYKTATSAMKAADKRFLREFI